MSELDGVHTPTEWMDIATLPDGIRAMLWLERGEKGNGEIFVGMIFRDERTGKIDGVWTWGGPNSGCDIEEAPTMWAHLPNFPPHVQLPLEGPPLTADRPAIFPPTPYGFWAVKPFEVGPGNKIAR